MPVSSNKRENFAAVIMAAGMGTRMKRPEVAKVMFELRGKPMVHYVLDTALAVGSEKVIAVVGFQHEGVVKYLAGTHPSVEYVTQEPQLGTGHAVMQTEQALADFSGNVLVLSGDVPLLRTETLGELLNLHRSSEAVATVLTAEFADPAGYGRIIRNSQGLVEKIVEQKDASAPELSVREINSGIYVFKKEPLFEGLRHISPHNAQNEYYLTDVFGYFWKIGRKVAAFKTPQAEEIQGINTHEQLQEAVRILEYREKALS
ncbi:MAG TPA: sugar phosphate nucleotidyltransferase [Bacteroidota bacterium]